MKRSGKKLESKRDAAKKIVVEENYDEIYDGWLRWRIQNDIFRCPCCNRELGRGNSENSDDFDELDINYCPGCGQRVKF